MTPGKQQGRGEVTPSPALQRLAGGANKWKALMRKTWPGEEKASERPSIGLDRNGHSRSSHKKNMQSRTYSLPSILKN